MPALALGLGIGVGIVASPDSSPVSEPPVAYAASGAAGSGSLDNPEDPFPTISGALDALVATYPGRASILDLQTMMAEEVTAPSLRACVAAGLTIRNTTGSGALIYDTVLNWTPEEPGENLRLTLDTIQIDAIRIRGTSVDTRQNAGTITFIGGASITNLYTEGDAGSAGANGAPGGTSAGGNGAPGWDGEYPTQGSQGDYAVADGGNGEPGGPGCHAANIRLLGSGYVANLYVEGGDGGQGGDGGIGGAAYAGSGGQGGNYAGDGINGPLTGGDGGNGGNAQAYGGNGGDGGKGGAGAIVQVQSGVGLNAVSFGGGPGAAGGVGGAPGFASAGGSGAGGSGPNGPGINGQPGAAFNANGFSGSQGSEGAAGQIIST